MTHGIDEVQAKDLEYLALATELLQRARLADAEAGLWEAADLQWWWCTPRRSDAIYDPALDLAAVTADGQVGGHALFWFDPVTQVGMLEPMRVEDEYQRRGVARAMLTAGLDRLAARGARRLKVSYATAAARSLYVGAGFRVTSTSTSYSWKRPPVTG